MYGMVHIDLKFIKWLKHHAHRAIITVYPQCNHQNFYDSSRWQQSIAILRNRSVDFHKHGGYALATTLFQQELCCTNLVENYVMVKLWVWCHNDDGEHAAWALLVKHPKTEWRMIMPNPRFGFIDCLQPSVVWASYQIRKSVDCACAGNSGNVFPRRRLQRKPLVSDPGMHHGTCVTQVPWCMSGSLTRGGGENVPGIPGACATRNFAYLARGPCEAAPT